MLDPVRDIICEPTRTQIVRVLRTGALSVGELSAILQRSKSATSQHLRVLRDAGVVSARRRGRTVMYSLTSTPMVDATVQVLDTAANFAAAWGFAGTLHRDCGSTLTPAVCNAASAGPACELIWGWS